MTATTWRLAPQERTPDEGAFVAVDTIAFTSAALELFGEQELMRALAILVTAAITRKLDGFQVLERIVDGVADGEILFATEHYGLLTLMLPSDW